MPSLLLDPTVVYLILIVGAWLGITAMYIPSTGIAEALALVVLGGAVFALAQLPVNWISVMLLIVGMFGFVIAPLFNRKHSRWSWMAPVVQGVASVFLYRGMVPNPFVIAVMLGLAFAYNHYLLLPMLDYLRDTPLVGDESTDLPGATGRVVGAVNPPESGTAQINGELWTIRSSVPLQRGDVVRVQAVNGLELHVERMKAKLPPREANGHHAEEAAEIIEN
ncbi:MAG: NfeD family protein [Chloroflexota bacterium]